MPHSRAGLACARLSFAFFMPFAAIAAIAAAFDRCRRPLALAAAMALAASAAPADELTDLPLERLLETEVVSAARFARQVTDAASAVSVLTAEDIRIFGLRTLGEVLDHMRGIHISHSLDYVYLGSRGVGGDSFASRVLMLVDGNPPPDNLYDQLYLGRDALLDVDLIERIEYAPGSGSAMYGNNALLGVINVVTRRGRDIDGLQVSGALGDWSQRTWRVSAGRRQANGLEWLASFTGHADTALPSPQIGDQFQRSLGHSQTVLLKAQWEGFSALMMTAQRRVATDYRDVPGEQFWYTTYLDRNELLALGHDSRPAEHWRLSLKAQTGRYAYRYHDDDSLWGHDRTVNDGRWWALDGQAGYDGWSGHRLVLGARLRHDPVQHFHSVGYEGDVYHFAASRRNLGFSAEDEFTLNEQWAFTAGVRADHRDQLPWTWSPRVAAVWLPTPAWSVKASFGRSARYRSAADTPQSMSSEDVLAPPREEAITATTSELVSEYREGNLRLLGSLYRFNQRNRVGLDGEVVSSRGRGLELEAEWQWRGWRVRGSQAWQDAESGDDTPLVYSPRHLTKLQLSAPLAGEALRLSATLRHTGAMLNYLGPVPSRNLLDLTLVSQKAVDGLDLRIGWRNLLQKREAATDEYYWEPPTGVATRSAWIELTGTFR